MLFPPITVIEGEVTYGIFNSSRDSHQNCYWFKRTFSNLFEQQPGDNGISTYTDITAGQKGVEFDVDMLKTLNHLKEAKMPAKYVG